MTTYKKRTPAGKIVTCTKAEYDQWLDEMMESLMKKVVNNIDVFKRLADR